ncbi:MAG: U32 family peptidase [Oceanospirillaceae bacterium]|jgi:collagenase-like PrtC family protease|nr:U32 family peptidase [Oceanospirillaceae bacterium]MBT4444022.1 U32 family peptidase [Oceanospirillaceae bacterium]MBT6077545.1 U32 family peptidase [Oceanospirillaceae bacterium]MBT7329799.1 U32 family peptidase [Oceanospirillaceae bacterium]
MQLALGPVPYFWPKQHLISFYEAMVDQPLDRIYLGETVCSKRREMRWQDWLDLARFIESKGIQVVLSSLTLIEAESELKQLKRLCKQDEFLVEANDMGAINQLSEMDKNFVTGPAINIYNARSLRLLQKRGLKRWTMPVELSKTSLSDTLAQAQVLSSAALPETEVFAFGQLPLAYSARCFTARQRNLAKDNCGFCCIETPQGVNVSSQDGEPLFTLNGIQTLSAKTYDLSTEVDSLIDLNVQSLRISPMVSGTAEAIAKFRHCIDGEQADAVAPTIPLMDVSDTNLVCNGYWYGEPGMNLNSQSSLR